MGSCITKRRKRNTLYDSEESPSNENQNSSSLLIDFEVNQPQSDSNCFTNELQREIDNWLIEAEKIFLNVVNIVNLPFELQRLVEISKIDYGWLKIIDSMINIVGRHTANGILEKDPIGPTIIILLLEDSPIPTRELIKDLHNVLDPYLSQRIHNPNDEIILKHRNICAILSFLAEKLAGSISVNLLTLKILKFLERIISENVNFLYVLFALNCLEKFALTKENKEFILKNFDVCKELCELEKYIHQYSTESLYHSTLNDLLKYQVGFCAQWCIDNVFVKKGRKLSYKKVDYSKLNVILNVNDKTEFLKLSPNGLSARCDTSTFECVRSTSSVMVGVYYYEAIVITNGIMQIGWATKMSDFKNYEGIGVGDDQYSIAFDGCRGVIWHNTHHYRHGLSRWNAGDVVGCLIDLDNKKFVFYLNGKKVEINKRISQKLNLNFEDKPYYAAVSLMAYQQCYFNFGQAPFKYPPKKYRFKNLNSDVLVRNTDDIKVVPMHVKIKSMKNNSFISKRNLCTICYDHCADIILKPCDHDKICHHCILSLDQCPFCRDEFSHYENA